MKKNKNKLFVNIILFSCFSILSCQKKETQKKEIISLKSNENIDLDKFIKCGNFIYDEGHFYTSDYGCIYNPKGDNKLGNIMIYLIPLDSSLKDEDIVKKMSKEEIKQKFKILLYLIKPSELNYNPKGDPIYYQKDNYTGYLYTYDKNLDKWNELDKKYITSTKAEEIWINDKLSNLISNNKTLSKEIDDIKNRATKNHLELLTEKECDINQDNIKDKILVFSNTKDFSSEDESTQASPIYILLGNNDGSYTRYQNSKIFKSHFGYYFHQLIIKDNYFTIELEVENPNINYEEKYITFKYDMASREIILHKLSSVITNNDQTTSQFMNTSKDFGIVKFNDFNTDTINDKRK